MAVEEGPGPAPKPRRLTRAQIEAAGGGEPVADEPAPHHPAATAPATLEEPGGLSHGPGTAFALNALDALSVVGLPTTLAMKDALTGSEGDFRSRYGKAKAFYEGGMQRLHDSNPKSSTVGQFAPILTPGGAAARGAGLGATVARGAVSGAAAGAFRGPSKLIEEGDVGGTVEDAAMGAGAGGLLSAGGALLGKGVEAGGKLARRGFGKVLDEVAKRTKSKQGEFAQLQQAGQAARRRLPFDRVDAEQTVPIGKGANEVLADRKMAQDAIAGAEKEKALAQSLKRRYGPSGTPPKAELDAGHMADLQKESNVGAKQLLGTAALTAGGYYAGKKLGVDPYLSGLAAGGAGAGFLVRKAALSVARNPAALQQLMKLEPIGQVLAKAGGRGGSAPGNIAAIIYSLRHHPEVARVLKEHEGQKGTSP